MKPVVKYNVDQFHSISKNRCAIVCPIDHPSHRVSNRNAVHTSTVIYINGDEFETLNTKYVPVHNGADEESEEPLEIPKFLRKGSD